MKKAVGAKSSGYKVFITGNQVCMKRGLDADLLKRYFLANGCSITGNPKEAQVIVAITCAFISSYVDSAVDMITRLKKYPARFIVMGCLPAMAYGRFKNVFKGEYLITRDHAKIDTLFQSFDVPLASLRDAYIPDIDVMKPFSVSDFYSISIRNSIAKGKSLGSFLRIGEGCNNSCTYCSHPRALGSLKSKPLDVCLMEYKDLIIRGFSYVKIHANDPGAYGLDIGRTYPELLHHLHDIDKDTSVKWGLSDINPKWLAKYRNELLEICSWERVASICIPLQSGSPRILKRMNRYSRIESVLDAIRAIKETNSSIKLATHLIAGFPGEDEEDISATSQMLEDVPFDEVYIFPFSPNPGTVAEEMEHSLSSEQIQLHKEILLKTLIRTGVKVDVFS